MFTKKAITVAIAAAITLYGALTMAAPMVRNEAVEVVGAGAVADPLIAVEANRSAIINRLAADFGEAAAQAGVNAETLRGVLGSLRADQLLAAALVGSFAELTAIVTPVPGADAAQRVSEAAAGDRRANG